MPTYLQYNHEGVGVVDPLLMTEEAILITDRPDRRISPEQLTNFSVNVRNGYQCKVFSIVAEYFHQSGLITTHSVGQFIAYHFPGKLGVPAIVMSLVTVKGFARKRGVFSYMVKCLEEYCIPRGIQLIQAVQVPRTYPDMELAYGKLGFEEKFRWVNKNGGNVLVYVSKPVEGFEPHPRIEPEFVKGMSWEGGVFPNCCGLGVVRIRGGMSSEGLKFANNKFRGMITSGKILVLDESDEYKLSRIWKPLETFHFSEGEGCKTFYSVTKDYRIE